MVVTCGSERRDSDVMNIEEHTTYKERKERHKEHKQHKDVDGIQNKADFTE